MDKLAIEDREIFIDICQAHTSKYKKEELIQKMCLKGERYKKINR